MEDCSATNLVLLRMAWRVVAIILLSSPTSAAASPMAMNLSMGLYKVEVSSPIFYESYVAIIYEYSVPQLQAVDVTLRDWREKCKTDNFSPSYTCPVFFYYERFLERFESEVVPKPWVKQEATPSVPRMGVDFCTTIQSHFPGSMTQQFGFEEYVKKLQVCPIGEVVLKRAIGDYIFDIKSLFKKMNKNYENEFSNSFMGAANSKLSPAFYVNAVTTHQNGMLVAYLLEKERWSQAELSCNSQMLPKSLVKMDNFSDTLGQLQQVMKAHNLVSSVNTDELSAFYKLPLADCSYIETNGNFVVRVQVPVLKKGLAPKLFKLESVPFVFGDEKGSESGKQLCQVRTDPRTYIFDKTSGILQESRCNLNSPLCKLDNFVTSDIISPCVSSVFSGSMEGVKKYCEMDCVPWKDLRDGLKMLPAFHKVQSNTWMVTGHPLSGVTMKCQGKQDKILELPDIGAVEVKLPCGCSLAYHSESYYPEADCEDESDPTVKHILPVHFIREEKLDEIQRFTGTGGNISRVPAEPDFVVSSMVGKSFEGFGAQSSAHVSSTENGNDNSGSLTFLWVVFVIQLIGFVVLAAVGIYKYVDRRRKLNAFSKERLVYNVYPSSSNPNLSSASTSSDTYTSYSQRPTSIVENNLNNL